MFTPPFARGELIPLSEHPCTNSTTNSTSDCCRVNTRTDECGVYFHDTFQHPCALCTSEEIPIPTKGLCNFCSEAYPEEVMESFTIGNNTIIEQLSRHVCSTNNDTTNCCLYDSTTDQCGLFANDEFAFPCGSCSTPPTNRSLDKNTIRGLVGGTIVIIFLLGAYFCWKRLHYQNLPSKMVIQEMAPEEPTAVPVGYDTEFEVAPVICAQAVPVPVPVPSYSSKVNE
jgi:hypothetical protein